MGNKLFKISLILAFLSGSSALGLQLLWTRRLIDLLGASAESNARVFGCFFLGLGFGSAVANYLISRITKPWRILAQLEGGIILFCLPLFFLPSWTGWIWPAIGPEAFTNGLSGWIKLFLSMVTIIPPAILMGIGLPIMVSALLHDSLELGRHGVWLYAINTLGGVFGLILISGVLLHRLGADGSMLYAMGLNCILCMAFYQIDRVWNREIVEKVDTSEDRLAIDRRLYHIVLAIAFFSGSGIIGLEVIGLQMYNLVATMSFYGPSSVLASVIFLLAVSALLLPILVKYFKGSEQIIPYVLSMSGLMIAMAPFLFMTIVSKWDPFRSNSSVVHFVYKFVFLVMVTLGPGLFFAGMLFPLAVSWLGTEGGDRHGRRLGWVLAVNGIGGLFGAEVAYRLLLPLSGVHYGIGLIAVSYSLLSIPFLLSKNINRNWISRIMPISLVIFTILFVEIEVKHLPHVDPKLPFKVLAEKHGREGNLAVIEHKDIGRGILMSNQYLLGSTTVRYDQERQAHLPIILNGNPRKVGFIGHATGITSGAALLHDGIESIVSVEIASIVVEAATEFFGEYNNQIASNSLARIVVEDGRTYFAASPNEFDIIVGDLYLPWGSGTGRLYSHEHFESINNALNSGGIFCQWLPMYQLSPQQFEVIAHTFEEVFKKVYLFRNGFRFDTPQVCLIGFKEGRYGYIDWEMVEKRCLDIRLADKIRDPIIRHPEGIGMLYLGRWQSEKADLPVNTLNNLWIEHNASLVRIAGNPETTYYYATRWLEFLQGLSERSVVSSSLEKDLYQLSQIGFSLCQWDLMVMQNHPELIEFTRIIQQNMPASIKSDSKSDWIQYPGNAIPNF